MPDQRTPAHILEEATELFVGKQGVIGVGLSNTGDSELTFFLEKHDIVLEQSIQAWARKRGVHSEFLIAGTFLSGVAA